MAAPLLPFEKSYSALISFAFLSRSTSSGDQAIFLPTLGVDDHQEIAQAPQSDCNVSVFTLRVRVLDRHRQRVLEYAFGVGKRDAVLPHARCGLGCVIQEEPHMSLYI